MKIVRWSPLEEINLLRSQIDKIFDPIHSESSNGDERSLNHVLPVEVTETPVQYRVRLLVPGINPDRVKLNCGERELSIAAEITPRELEKDEIIHVNNFQYGKFSKQLNFPEMVDTDRVEARYEFGILEVTLPKMESSQRKSIEIQINR